MEATKLVGFERRTNKHGMIRLIKSEWPMLLGPLGHLPGVKQGKLFRVKDSDGVETSDVDKQPWPRLFERKCLHAIRLDLNVGNLFGGRRIDDTDERVRLVGTPASIDDVQIFGGRIVRIGVTVIFQLDPPQ